MNCLLDKERVVKYPCSPNCHLFGDCLVEFEKQNSANTDFVAVVMRPNRKDCPMRHKNGNCLPAGGFCTAVNDSICEALHNAYECGKSDLIDEYKKFMADKQISEPVKHGRWEYKGEQKGYFCSVCHSGCLLNMESDWHLSKYCPHCGAYMDTIEQVIGEGHSETKVWEVK